MTTEEKITIPTYLRDEYVIQNGEHLTCLDSLVAWYWCSIPILRENVTSCGKSWQEFLKEIKNCVTMLDMKKLVNQYI